MCPPSWITLPSIRSHGGFGLSLHHVYVRYSTAPDPSAVMVSRRPWPFQAPTKIPGRPVTRVPSPDGLGRAGETTPETVGEGEAVVESEGVTVEPLVLLAQPDTPAVRPMETITVMSRVRAFVTMATPRVKDLSQRPLC